MNEPKIKSVVLYSVIIISLASLAVTYNLKRAYNQLTNCLPPTDVNQTSICLDNLSKLEPGIRLAHQLFPRPVTATTLSLINAVKPLLPHTDYLLGIKEPVNYLVLLQNNTEMRANGGFFGSYAKLNLSPTSSTINFQDIYTPDGQITGHVDPPPPIQLAFRQGWFKLRDADWEPDFPTSATTIRWFLTKGKELNPDVLITLSLSTIQELLKITGPVELDLYNLTLNSQNAFPTLQGLVEQDFFPGSTQKKDTLTAAGNAFTQKLYSLPPQDLLKIADLLLKDLENQNILLNSTNPKLQQLFIGKNWAGELKPPTCQQENCLLDSLAVIETNLGANKANCCVARNTTHQITKNDQLITHQLTINYTNNSPPPNQNSLPHHGGNYINYLRLYLPTQAQNISVSAHPSLPTDLDYYPKPYLNQADTKEMLSLNQKYGFQELGFFHLTKASGQSSVSLSYQLPTNNQQSYQLSILKQHGLASSPHSINLFGQKTTTNLNQDYIISTTTTTR